MSVLDDRSRDVTEVENSLRNINYKGMMPSNEGDGSGSRG